MTTTGYTVQVAETVYTRMLLETAEAQGLAEARIVLPWGNVVIVPVAALANPALWTVAEYEA